MKCTHLFFACTGKAPSCPLQGEVASLMHTAIKQLTKATPKIRPSRRSAKKADVENKITIATARICELVDFLTTEKLKPAAPELRISGTANITADRIDKMHIREHNGLLPCSASMSNSSSMVQGSSTDSSQLALPSKS